MRVSFFGVRGSIPVPLISSDIYKKIKKTVLQTLKDSPDPDKIDSYLHSLPLSYTGSYGGSSCVLIDDFKTNDNLNHLVIIDAGSGIRELGNIYYIKKQISKTVLHIFLSHLHWDHIQGLPFFLPAYIPGVKINFYSAHKNFQQNLENQQNFDNFPVTLNQMASEKTFNILDNNETIIIDDISVTPHMLAHPNDSYSFKVENSSKGIVYASDIEIRKNFTGLKDFIKYIGNSQILIFDSQYSLTDAFRKFKDFGHSFAESGIEIALETEIKKLVLFHHDPNSTDEELEKILFKAKKWKNYCDPDNDLEIICAYEGLKIKL